MMPLASSRASGLRRSRLQLSLLLLTRLKPPLLIYAELPVGEGRPHAGGEARFGLHQDNLGAQPAQHLGCDRGGDDLPEIGHADTLQRQRRLS